jgi:hypothetical protein
MLTVLAAVVAAALPTHGTLVPARSLGGVRLGDTPPRVRALWGPRYGTCTSCPHTTWYFNYARYQPQGAGVEFRNARVVAVFTLWSPSGWRTSAGLRTEEPAARITRLYGALPRATCGTYDAYLQTRANVTTVFYVFDGKVWGFGLSRPWVSACR